MDALSVLLQNVHLFETKYYRLNGAGNWSYSMSRKDTILFYLVMSGGFCIDVGNGLREARAGDMIMIPNAHKHVSYALNHHGDVAEPLDELLTNCQDRTLEIDGNGDPNS